MCTVSWTAAGDRYDLFFNRDELHARAAERPPTIEHWGDAAYLAPHDGERGGTWLATNEFGLTVCLLNDYAASWRPRSEQPHFSRGHIVRSCAGARTHAEVFSALRAQPLMRTWPFQLVALSPGQGTAVARWWGGELNCSTVSPAQPITSSSYATQEVVAARIHRFRDFVPSHRDATISELRAYHGQHDRAAGAHSILMRRSDAATRSVCHVSVNEYAVQLTYATVSTTTTPPVLLAPLTLSLPRRVATTAAA